jgi:hypothetical protein
VIAVSSDPVNRRTGTPTAGPRRLPAGCISDSEKSVEQLRSEANRRLEIAKDDPESGPDYVGDRRQIPDLDETVTIEVREGVTMEVDP